MPHQMASRLPASPDDARMTFGEHLEELRRRLIYALVGLLAAVILCINFGDRIIETLTAPYCIAMRDLDQDARLIQLDPIESFMEYFKICVEFGLVLAAPWILYQLWLFVAVGLYPSERRIIRYFAPASIGLFLLGASFMIAVVLTGLIKFLLSVAAWFPLPGPDNMLYRWLDQRPAQAASAPVEQPPAMVAPVVDSDPPAPLEGQIWINRGTRRLNVHYEGQTHFTSLQQAARQQFVQPFFSISEYLGFVVRLALAFGLGFQIPIVVVFLIATRILGGKQIGKARRYVTVGVFVIAAVLTPSPDIGSMLLLAVPMILLFEIGLAIGRVIERRGEPDAAE